MLMLLERSKCMLNLAQTEWIQFHTKPGGEIHGATVHYPSGAKVELETEDAREVFAAVFNALQAMIAQAKPQNNLVQPVTLAPGGPRRSQ
jgi:hypothetical protein